MTRTPMGVGIIGAGNISAAYLRLSPLFAGYEIRAVADINLEAAEARAGEFGVRASSVSDLLASDDIDVVVNLTIPAAHFEVTSAILDAGKHAYSEKPFALSAQDAVAIGELAARKGLRVGTAPDTFLGGAHQQARMMIDRGDIGDVVSGTAHVMSRGMEDWHPNPDFFYQPGAGPILDIGPYYVANLVQILGPVKRVASLGRTAFAERTIKSEPRRGETVPVETPTTFHALLDFANGAAITLGASWDVSDHRHGNMELYGTDATLFVPDPNFFGGDLEMTRAGARVEAVAPWDHVLGVPNQIEPEKVPRANYRGAGLADMIAAIHEDRPHRCSLDLGTHAIDVMTSILASAEAGTFIDLTTTCARPAPLDPEAARALLAP